MEQKIIRIERAPDHQTQQEELCSVVPIAQKQEYMGIEITLVCIEYYEQSFTVLYRLRITNNKLFYELNSFETKSLIPVVRADFSDNLNKTYNIVSEPFIGSQGDWHGIFRAIPIVDSLAATLHVHIESVIFYSSEDGRTIGTTTFNTIPWIFNISTK